MCKNYLDRITIEPGKCGGRPCIRGYRLRVADVLDLLAAGASPEEILKDYDFLEPEDLLACYQFGAIQSGHRMIPLQPAYRKLYEPRVDECAATYDSRNLRCTAAWRTTRGSLLTCERGFVS